MPRKCSVYGCTTRYRHGENISVYRFPTDQVERQKWIRVIPNKLSEVTDHMGVCANHWHPGVPMNRKSRYPSPAIPPNKWPEAIPPSCIRHITPPRDTLNSTSDVRDRSQDVDEMPAFLRLDLFQNAENEYGKPFKDCFLEAIYPHGVVGIVSSSEYTLRSRSRIGVIHSFSVYFKFHQVSDECTRSTNSIGFEGYFGVKLAPHSKFSSGIIRHWSELTEVLRFYTLHPYLEDEEMEPSKTPSKIQEFIERQIELINAPNNQRIYAPNDLILAFSWFTRSRALYTLLRSHLRLPSKSTLGKITRRAKNTEDFTVYTQFFFQQQDRSKACAIIVDEMYVKSSLQYCGGVLYGFAEDNTEEKATTILAIMVKCFFGGKKFLAKLVPCHALTAGFHFEVVSDVINSVEQCGGKVITIINDNNRTNQAFFKLFNPFNPLCPWIVHSLTTPSRPMFLLYDSVHIMKNIRNNWTTERTKSLSFPVIESPSNDHVTACWGDIVELFNHETNLVKLSKLTKSAVWPSNTEKQSVSLALQVFCDETSSALTCTSISNSSWKMTAHFVKQVVVLWKLLNCKSPFQSTRFNDPDRVVIDNGTNGERGMGLLSTWAEIAIKMRPTSSVRVQSLTKDTSLALEWSCKCLQDLARYLLHINEPWKHEYVCLGFFQQDDLERHFGHFRTSAGSNYYLSVKDVLNTHSLDRTRLLLAMDTNMDSYDDKHHCPLCTLPLTANERRLMESMKTENYISKVSIDEQNAIVYIAGYVAFKNNELKGSLSNSDATSYFNDRDRNGLCSPCEEFLEFMLLAYCFFVNNKTAVCRTRLTALLGYFTQKFDIDVYVSSKALNSISNIFLKRFAALQNTQMQVGGSKRKVAKLTSV